VKLVVAVVQPFKLEAVKNALKEVGVAGMTITEVRGYGHQKGHTEIYRGAEYAVSLLPKAKVEIAIPAISSTKWSTRSKSRRAQAGSVTVRFLSRVLNRPCGFARERLGTQHFNPSARVVR
jgi:nitrogen regulatory protein PII